MIKMTELASMDEPFISAASGLILINKEFYVVSDDDLSLYSFGQKDLEHNLKVKLFAGKLPKDKKARKKIKPDLECLVQMPVSSFHPYGAILAVPSGSEKNRTRGALINFNKKGELTKKVQEIDFKDIYEYLRGVFPELNIEGAVVVGDKLKLFQRGNGKKAQNASIDMNLQSLLLNEVEISHIEEYELQKIDGVHYSFTDVCSHKDHVWFLAVAENSKSTFLDGEVLGSILGKMSSYGKILATYELGMKSKPEGLCVDGKNFYVVTDDDDPKVASKILKGKLP